ncbi:MAG TPA: hypothetical protein VL325_05205 [Pyrinomonadaceae bacterium]|nr:hypothetical protein [Pyrinomonadaceae bacterium]
MFVEESLSARDGTYADQDGSLADLVGLRADRELFAGIRDG